MKKIFTMCVMMLCCLVAVMAQEFNVTTDEGYELKYGVLDADAKTAECRGLADYTLGGAADLMIPDSVEYNDVWYQVTAIEGNAFYDCDDFTGSLVIGNSVKHIGAEAFRGCSGFTGSLTIPDAVTNVEESAFYGCSGFTGSLTISDGVESIGNSAFEGCSGFSGKLILNDLISESNRVFAGCTGLEEVVMSDGVESIGDEVFEGCTGLMSLKCYGRTVKQCGNNVFGGIPDNQIILYADENLKDEYASWGGYAFQSYGVSEFIATSGAYDLRYVVTNYEGGGYWDKEVECIGLADENAEGGEDDLVIPVEVQDSNGQNYLVTSIGGGAFYSCNGFTGSLTIGNAVERIGGGAFHDCRGFTGRLMIGMSVKDIGLDAFCWCIGFSSIYSQPATPPVARVSEFGGTFRAMRNVPVSVPSGSEEDYEKATGWSYFKNFNTSAFSAKTAEGYELCYVVNTKDKKTVTLMGVNKQTKAPGEADLVIPQKVSHNGVDYAVTNIGTAAFSRTPGFTGRLIIPEGVETLEEYAFAGFNWELMNFTGSLTIPNSVKIIGRWALGYNTGFTDTLTLGASIESIESMSLAHIGSDAIHTVVNRATVPLLLEYDPFTFSNIDKVRLLVPEASIELYENAAIWQDFMSIGAMPKEIYDVEFFIEGSAARQVLEIEEGDNVISRILPELGYEIESVSVNGEDVTSSLSEDGRLTIENIAEDKIVLVKTKSVGGTDAPQALIGADFTAWGAQGSVYVETTEDMEWVRIIDFDGRVVYTASVEAYSVMQVPVAQSGAYVVQTAKGSKKVVVD